ncbi:hypothetical protein MPER_01753, partial [Moniliophthora perniciosa FA553]
MEMGYRGDSQDVVEPLVDAVTLEEFDGGFALENIEHTYYITSSIRHGLFRLRMESMGTRKWDMVTEVQKRPEARLKGMLSVLDTFKALNGLSIRMLRCIAIERGVSSSIRGKSQQEFLQNALVRYCRARDLVNDSTNVIFWGVIDCLLGQWRVRFTPDTWYDDWNRAERQHWERRLTLGIIRYLDLKSHSTRGIHKYFKKFQEADLSPSNAAEKASCHFPPMMPAATYSPLVAQSLSVG